MTTAEHGMAGQDRPMSGKVALVTGASRGIGAAIAAAFADAGAQVVLAARDGDALSRQVEAIRGSGGSAVAVRVDVTSEDSVGALLAEVQKRFGRLDAAVNNAAGGGEATGAARRMDQRRFRQCPRRQSPRCFPLPEVRDRADVGRRDRRGDRKHVLHRGRTGCGRAEWIRCQ